MEYFIDLLIVFISILFVAFFSSSEASLLGVNKIRIHQMADSGHRGAKAVQRVMHKHEKFFASILLTENAFIIFGSSFGTAMAISLLGEEGYAVAIATVAMTILIVSFGEITPKTVALRYSDFWAPFVANFIELIMKVETPIIYLFTLPPRLLVRIISGKNAPRPTLVSDEEIRTMISLGHAEGTVEHAEAQLLHGVFDFGDLRVEDVMVPRIEVKSIEQSAKVSDLLELFAEYPLSRFIVYKENMDNVVGIISIKDLFITLAKDTITKGDSIEELIRPAHITPEGKRVSDLFFEMQEKNFRIGVVIDEFGGTAGVVTLNRLLEEIVGPVGDELRVAEKEYEVIDEYTYRVDGSMRIEEANEKMELDLPEGKYETLAGFLLFLLGRIPERGEQLIYHKLRFVITKKQGHKIEEIMISKEKKHKVLE